MLLKRTMPPLNTSGPNHEFSDGADDVVAGGTGGGGKVPKRKTLEPSFVMVPSPEMPRFIVTTPVPFPPRRRVFGMTTGVVNVKAPAPFCTMAGLVPPKVSVPPAITSAGSVGNPAASVAFRSIAFSRNGTAGTSFVAV